MLLLAIGLFAGGSVLFVEVVVPEKSIFFGIVAVAAILLAKLFFIFFQMCIMFKDCED
jgi:hypothetical protein